MGKVCEMKIEKLEESYFSDPENDTSWNDEVSVSFEKLKLGKSFYNPVTPIRQVNAKFSVVGDRTDTLIKLASVMEWYEREDVKRKSAATTPHIIYVQTDRDGAVPTNVPGASYSRACYISSAYDNENEMHKDFDYLVKVMKKEAKSADDDADFNYGIGSALKKLGMKRPINERDFDFITRFKMNPEDARFAN